MSREHRDALPDRGLSVVERIGRQGRFGAALQEAFTGSDSPAYVAAQWFTARGAELGLSTPVDTPGDRSLRWWARYAKAWTGARLLTAHAPEVDGLVLGHPDARPVVGYVAGRNRTVHIGVLPEGSGFGRLPAGVFNKADPPLVAVACRQGQEPSHLFLGLLSEEDPALIMPTSLDVARDRDNTPLLFEVSMLPAVFPDVPLV